MCFRLRADSPGEEVDLKLNDCKSEKSCTRVIQDQGTLRGKGDEPTKRNRSAGGYVT